MSARPVPAQGCVEVWLLREREEPGAVALPPDEEARAARMATAALGERTRRRRRFLRRVLAGYLGLAPEAVQLVADERGKLRLSADTGLHFNLSHSGEVSVLAVGREVLGIDVEAARPFDGLAALVAHSCSPRERAAILASGDAAAAFLDRWVLKEAVLKCRGTGLVDDLQAVDPGRAAPEPWRSDGLTLSTLPLPMPTGQRPRLHAALAVEGRLAAIRVMSLGRRSAGLQAA